MKPISLFKTSVLQRWYGLSLFSGEGKGGCWECSDAEFLWLWTTCLFHWFLTTQIAAHGPHLPCRLPSAQRSPMFIPATWSLLCQSWEAPAQQANLLLSVWAEPWSLEMKQTESTWNTSVHLPSLPWSVHKDQAKSEHGLFRGGCLIVPLFSTVDYKCYINVVLTSRENESLK